MEEQVLEVSATAFKARCLAMFKDLEARRLTRVIVTRRGRPIDELHPPKTRVPTLWGAHRGSVQVPPGVDLTAPVLEEEPDAERGILHR